MPSIKRMRNAFDLSHTRLASMHMGNLVPVLCEDVIPGDTWKVSTDAFVRFMPMVSPAMHPVNVGIHYWFVPYRIVWDNWEKFITGYDPSKVHTAQTPGNVPTQVPVILPERYTNNIGSLADHLGIPVTGGSGPGPNWSVSALPFRAYTKIVNDWYRNIYLQPQLTLSIDDGVLIDGEFVDTQTSTGLATKNWEKDYFTSALPFTQVGAESYIPISGDAPVVRDTNIPIRIRPEDSLDTFDSTATGLTTDGSSKIQATTTNHPLGDSNVVFENYDDGLGLGPRVAGLSVSLEENSTVTVNELRLSVQIQRWAERMARYGSRYVEILLSIFGIRSSDARLQRPEFLGGGTLPVTISEVLQTSETSTTPQGTLAGHGIAGRSINGFTKTFEEHGVIIALAYVLPRSMYMNGIPRFYNKRSKFDFYWPQFAHLGQQAIQQREIYAADDETTNPIFGYQDRYDEYRRRENSVSGEFRTTLKYWHLGRDFAASPTLSNEFLTASASNTTGGVDERVFADDTDDTVLCSFNHHITSVRPLPITGEPGLMDHF